MTKNDIECWIRRLLCVDFKGKEIIEQQIKYAKFSIEEKYAYISIKFSKGDCCELFPYNVRVPVEMRVFQEQKAPIVFMIHIIDGYTNELEIITADSSQVNLYGLRYQKVEYEINRELAL